MNRMLVRLLCLGWIIGANVASASSATSNRIEGVSQFLLERANENYLYMTITQIKENDAFACYFPNTYEYATTGKESFKMLLTSTGVWKKSVNADLDALAARMLYEVAASGKATNLHATMRDSYLELLDKIQLVYEGKTYPITSIPVSASKELRDTINQFYKDANAATEKVVKFQAAVNDKAEKCVSKSDSFKAFLNDMEHLKQALVLTQAQLKVFENTRTALILPTTYPTDLGNIDKLIEPLVKIYALSELASKDTPAVTGDTYLAQVIEIEKTIRSAIDQGVNPLGLDTESKEYARFRRYIVSFASLADAESPDTVKVAMQELTLPAISFGLKRQPGENGVFISAFLGVAGGIEKGDSGDNSESGDDSTYAGLFVPVGIEYSRGIPGHGSVSLMLAPFDFAQPVNLELEDKEESVDFGDIVRPGMYFSYGLKDYPLSFGFGVSKGKALKLETDDKVTQFNAFIVIDMPLLQLF